MVVRKEELEAAHRRYDEALLIKSRQLPELDRWYRTELSATLQQRRKGKKDAASSAAYLTSDELVKLMKWKLTRGKFRPRLEQLAKSNSDEFVRECTGKAYKLLDDGDTVASRKEAMSTLCQLKGVGPATSSAVMALFNFDNLPFMSDEGLEYAAGLKGKPKYTPVEWVWYVDEMRDRVKKEAWKGKARELEEAAWAYSIISKSTTMASSKRKTTNEEAGPVKKGRR